MNDSSRLISWLHLGVLDGIDLDTEVKQAVDEGRDLSGLAAEIDGLLAIPKPEASVFPAYGGGRDLAWRDRAAALVDRIHAAPFLPEPDEAEPNELAAIQALRPPAADGPAPQLGHGMIREKLEGGLLGRIAGCLLGKPFESWPRQAIRIWCEETGNWPVTSYLREPDEIELARIQRREPGRHLEAHQRSWVLRNLSTMPEDDDTSYTVAGWQIVERHGPGFTSDHVARFWCEQIPLFRTYTAERIAYRNFAANILPPASATFRNPYREWIGAQIRADFYGYANPGNPERAAEWAWRDARVSHVKNGIYGSMWVAAMVAAAYTAASTDEVISLGLGQIPGDCRLARAIRSVLSQAAAGVTFEAAVEDLHQRWNERDMHHWCHTISNAEVVAMALIYGGGHFDQTLGCAIMSGFDTDCNAATAGSVCGVLGGLSSINRRWKDPLGDEMLTYLIDFRSVRISDVAEGMAATISRTGY